MSLLPDTDRILLGPGPSLTEPRVMRAMAAPTVSHLDPLMLRLLDAVRARLGRLFRAVDGSFAFAVSGTGTSGMETAVANLVRDGTRATVIVTGYFGDRLAQMCERYGAAVTRLDVEWGRACDPDALRQVDAKRSEHAMSGEYVTQMTAIGPLGLEFIDSMTDPRNL
jgi:alanine-glyoxylate transaminase/serine-glyoxylate transaminase/serine-pyruvate transaminase